MPQQLTRGSREGRLVTGAALRRLQPANRRFPSGDGGGSGHPQLYSEREAVGYGIMYANETVSSVTKKDMKRRPTGVLACP